nr:NADH dehydrogenase subunit 6 [Microheliella maris]
MTVELFLFYTFAALAIISATMVVSAKNPIHSVLFLVLVFFNCASLLILLEVEFLAFIFLVVYIGAIAVLFLFVVMMLNIRIIEYKESLIRYLPIGGFIGLIFLLETLLVLNNDLIPLLNLINTDLLLSELTWLNYTTQYFSYYNYYNVPTNTAAVGSLIYTSYFYLFIIAGFILLVSMIGAIVLTMYHRANVKRQEIHHQVYKNFEKTIRLKSLDN